MVLGNQPVTEIYFDTVHGRMKGTKAQTLGTVACARVGLRFPVVDWEPADIKLAYVPQVDTPRSLVHAL